MPGILGKVTITIAGKRYNSKEGATLDVGGNSREPVIGDGGVAGFQSKNEAPKIDCTFIATPDISTTELQKIEDANISFDGDNGKSWVITGGFNGPVPQVSRDGIKCTFYGTDCKEA